MFRFVRFAMLGLAMLQCSSPKAAGRLVAVALIANELQGRCVPGARFMLSAVV